MKTRFNPILLALAAMLAALTPTPLLAEATNPAENAYVKCFCDLGVTVVDDHVFHVPPTTNTVDVGFLAKGEWKLVAPVDNPAKLEPDGVVRWKVISKDGELKQEGIVTHCSYHSKTFDSHWRTPRIGYMNFVTTVTECDPPDDDRVYVKTECGIVLAETGRHYVSVTNYPCSCGNLPPNPPTPHWVNGLVYGAGECHWSYLCEGDPSGTETQFGPEQVFYDETQRSDGSVKIKVAVDARRKACPEKCHSNFTRERDIRPNTNNGDPNIQ